MDQSDTVKSLPDDVDKTNPPTSPTDESTDTNQPEVIKYAPGTHHMKGPRLTLTEAPSHDTIKRVVPSVSHPATSPLASEKLWNDNGLPNLQILKEHFIREGRIEFDDAKRIIEMASKILRPEPNLLAVEAPITICGDIHGQFYDLVKLFQVGGEPGETRYLFLGDYVDRGCFSCECVLFLYACKISFPDKFFMLRGNHESRHMTEHFNFKTECKHKYSEQLYEIIMDSFDCLPLCAIVNNNFFCVHGGISPEFEAADDIKELIMEIDRYREPPSSGLMCDLLWADPLESYDERLEYATFDHNHTRQCSYFVPYRKACDFLDRLNLLSIIRAHEACDQGYVMFHNHEDTNFPSLITIFSAPNYADVYNNRAAILRYDGERMNIRQFRWSEHPYWLPDFMDAFDWSLPFIAEKVAEMFVSLLNHIENLDTDDDDDDDDDDDSWLEALKNAPSSSKPSSLSDEAASESITTVPDGYPPKPQSLSLEERKQAEAERAARIRLKIQTLARFRSIASTYRQEHETVVKLRGYAPNNKIPRGLLLQGPAALRNAAHEYESHFQRVKAHDRFNESRPAVAVPQSSTSTEQSASRTTRPTNYDKPSLQEAMALAQASTTQAPPTASSAEALEHIVPQGRVVSKDPIPPVSTSTSVSTSQTTEAVNKS